MGRQVGENHNACQIKETLEFFPMKRVSWESSFRKFLIDVLNNLLTFPNHAFAAMTIVNYQVNVIVKVDMRPT